MKEQKPKKFSVKMQKKLLCLYALIILAFILLSVRLTWIVKADGAAYEKQVLSQQKYDSINYLSGAAILWMPKEPNWRSARKYIIWSSMPG